MFSTIIFDLGGVLIDWNPAYVFRQLFDTVEEMQWFFDNICTSDWNEEQDAGRSLADATAERIALFPEWEDHIRAYYGRWEEMLGEAIQPTVDILRELKEKGEHRIYALTNWSAETFPVAQERFEFLQWFEGILVSGEEKMRKPQPEIYQLVLSRYDIQASEAIFIDDNLRNVKAAEKEGIRSIHFQSGADLRQQLEQLAIL